MTDELDEAKSLQDFEGHFGPRPEPQISPSIDVWLAQRAGYLICARQEHAERQALEAKVVMATESAKRLAVAIWTQHYHFDAPSWQPFDDLMGLLSQIDNMVIGLSRSQPAAAQVPQSHARSTPVRAGGEAMKLTPTEIIAIAEKLADEHNDKTYPPHSDEPLVTFARAIEAAAYERAANRLRTEGEKLQGFEHLRAAAVALLGNAEFIRAMAKG